MLRTACVALVALSPLLGGSVHASTLVYPHALFMDDEDRSCVLYVHNSGHIPTEIDVTLMYGYPASDSLGGVHMELIEDPPPGQPSAAGWIRALPRRVVVDPGERQAIRLLARPPEDLPPGEYWSRVIVASRKAQSPHPVGSDGTILVGLALETRTIISASYRQGAVQTGIELSDFHAAIRDGNLVADVDLERTGNAAYLGRLELGLIDEAGRTVERWERVIAVYHDIYRRFAFPVPGLGPGSYRLHLCLSTTRTDIPSGLVLPARTIEADTQLSLSASVSMSSLPNPSR